MSYSLREFEDIMSNENFHHLSWKEVKDSLRKMGEKKYDKMIDIHRKFEGDEDIKKFFEDIAEFFESERNNIFRKN